MSVEKRGDRWLARVLQPNGKRTSRMFDTKRDALAWEAAEKAAIRTAGQPLGDGPHYTTLAQAMRLFAERESVKKKGWKQELNRLNKWRALAGEPRLKGVLDDKGRLLDIVDDDAPLALPRAFAAYRAQRLAISAQADVWRAKLAALPMSRIAFHQIEDFEKALRKAGMQPDTIRLEIALLKRIFNVSRTKWMWRYDAYPFAGYALPEAGPQRDVRVPADKEAALMAELARCKSPYILPYVQLAIATTMRRSEILVTATWDDVDLTGRTIRLRRDKAGPGRLVPLSQEAVAILQGLSRRAVDDRIFPITPNQLHCAWVEACQRAGITNLRIHDLRHEGTSRYALRLNGNTFLLKKITGHRTLHMLDRYVNLSNAETLAAMDQSQPASPPADSPPQQTGAPTVLALVPKPPRPAAQPAESQPMAQGACS